MTPTRHTPARRAAPRAFLGLLHPTGAARVRVLGAGCPPALRPAAPAAGPAALVVYAPTPAELRGPEDLRRALARLARECGPDSAAYLLLPPRWRLAAARGLAALGLSVRLRLLHLPDLGASRYLVPLAPGPLRHAAAELIPTSPARRALALALLGAPGGAAALALALPGVGLLAQPAGAPPPLAWLRAPGGATLRRSGDGATAAAYGFAPGAASPCAVVKVGLSAEGAARVVAEGARLRRLGPAAARAGAAVPAAELRAGPALALSPLAGRPAALALAEAPGRLPACAAALAAWVTAWNLATRQERALDAAAVERELRAQLAAMAPALPGWRRYAARLGARCRELDGSRTPYVATHGDLTMWNVLLDGGALGVVDWEAARPAALPLADLVYALADGAAAATGYADRPAAVRACFAPGGAHQALVAPLLAGLRRALGVAPPLAQLCFHACWIGHGANEIARGAAGPFVAVVRWLSEGGAPTLGGDDER
jgi:hypothetical protein